MKKTIAHILLLLTLSPVVQAQTAESLNAKILHRAAQLLADESHWDRADTRECPPNAAKLSLYCALRQATEEVMGQSAHRTTAMEEVRRVIQEHAGTRYQHRLMGYNNDPTTTLADIHAVLRTAAERLDQRLAPIKRCEFTRRLLLETNAETSAGLSIGDVNRDGFPDLVLGKGRHWPLQNRVLLNDGKGHFTASNLGGTPDRTYSAALADVNQDGCLDVVVSNDRPDGKLVYLGDGRGKFQVAGTFGQPEWPTRYITLADLNGDGYQDIIAANRGGRGKQSSFICLNDGHGRFPSSHPLEGTESATIIVAADLDGDGAIDLLVPHRDGGQSLIFWNDGKGNFTKRTQLGLPNSAARAAAAADLNGDGRPDLVVGDENQGLFVYLNRGGRSFSEPILVSGK
ncbi:MAG: FG-GAP repeat domain-containing protein, partial [Limisphaerales bacterium]